MEYKRHTQKILFANDYMNYYSNTMKIKQRNTRTRYKNT